ncbi:hypothetical protein B0I37DRAFT_409920 [Chaetomium sp. MPI-CAGE-AT-0009]|nr:hypothetical protein B0I37DRAFT_409920 [Chaetomium sp. MPI-CAGE-AT-0009]
MAYFDSVHNPSTFRRKALSEGAQALRSLLDVGRPIPVSSWGREQLFALRVLCAKPGPGWNGNLPLLESHLPESIESYYIRALVDSPARTLHELSIMPEPQIVRSYNPDSLGSTWAALSALLRPLVNQDSHGQQEDAEGHGAEGRRPSRDRRPPNFFGNPVPTNSVKIGSPSSDSTSVSSSAISSVGYTENPQAPVVEDLTLRLASCFVRLVLNYGQAPEAPVLEFRDERVSTRYQLQAGPARIIQAIDDGGVRLFQPGKEARVVALMEAKRCFQVIEEGRPTVSDGLLAQMAGQALLVLLDKTQKTVSPTSIITIHATRHYVRFFSFETTLSYLSQLESLSPNDHSNLYFSVKSTNWFDIATEEGREMTVRHLLALVQWAHKKMEDGSNEEINQEDMENETGEETGEETSEETDEDMHMED